MFISPEELKEMTNLVEKSTKSMNEDEPMSAMIIASIAGNDSIGLDIFSVGRAKGTAIIIGRVLAEAKRLISGLSPEGTLAFIAAVQYGMSLSKNNSDKVDIKDTNTPEKSSLGKDSRDFLQQMSELLKGDVK